MNPLLRAIGGLAALFLLMVLIGFVLPGHYRVERTVVVQAPVEKVFSHVADLRNWPSWAVLFERDPALKLVSSEQTAGVGSTISWQSATQGNGSVEVTLYDPPKRMGYRLHFPDFGMTSRGDFTVTPVAGGGFEVRWGDEGEIALNPIHRWMGLFMDRMLGPDFEAGLAKLKQVVEATP